MRLPVLRRFTKRKCWRPLAIIIGLLFCVVSVSFAVAPTLTPTDREVPDFSLHGADGTLYNNERLKGKTWLINFWAVWCAPCLDELPSLNKAWAQLKNENVGMLAINIGEDADKIEQFLNEQNLQIDFPIVIGDKIRTLGNWSGSGLPFTVVISPAGKVVYEAVGPREWHEPQFVNTVLAINESVSVQSINKIGSSLFSRFHDLSNPVKVAVVFMILVVFVALMKLIGTLLRHKSLG